MEDFAVRLMRAPSVLGVRHSLSVSALKKLSMKCPGPAATKILPEALIASSKLSGLGRRNP